MAEIPDVPLDARTSELLLEAIRAEAGQRIEEAKQATRIAREPAKPTLPTFPAELPRGSFEVGETGSIVAELEAYGVIGEITGDIVTAILQDLDLDKSKPGKPLKVGNSQVSVWLVDSLDVAEAGIALKLLTSRAEILTTVLDQQIVRLPPVPTEPPASRKGPGPNRGAGGTRTRLLGLETIAATGIGLVSSLLSPLLSALKTDVSIHGRKMTASWSALAASMTRYLLWRGVEVHVRGLSTPVVGGPGVISKLRDLDSRRIELADRQHWLRVKDLEGATQRELTEAFASRDAAKAALKEASNAVERKKAEAALKDAERVVAQKQALIDKTKYLIDSAQSILDDVAAFIAGAFEAPENEDPAIALALMYEAYTADKSTYVLYVNPAAAGGESIYQRGVATEKAHHIGGASVAWMLSNVEGIKSAGLLTQVGQLTSSLEGKPVDRGTVQIGQDLSVSDPTNPNPPIPKRPDQLTIPRRDPGRPDPPPRRTNDASRFGSSGPP